MVGFKFGSGYSKKSEKDYYFVDIFFTEKWYKRVFLSKKQFDKLQEVTITVIEK